MKVSVFGLGYVGSVSAACFADGGHHVIGVDPNQTKVDLMRKGKAPIVEPDLGDMTRRAVARKLMSATADSEEALLKTEISFVCVGTPSRGNGSLDLDYLEGACVEIGRALRKKKRLSRGGRPLHRAAGYHARAGDSNARKSQRQKSRD